MQSKHVQVEKWASSIPPTEAELRRRLEQGGLTVQRWTNVPNEVYQAHEHPYDKILYVVSGSIVFGFPIVGKPVTLYAGDRLEIPAHLAHNAAVGTDGVVCLEAHRLQ